MVLLAGAADTVDRPEDALIDDLEATPNVFVVSRCCRAGSGRC